MLSTIAIWVDPDFSVTVNALGAIQPEVELVGGRVEVQHRVGTAQVMVVVVPDVGGRGDRGGGRGLARRHRHGDRRHGGGPSQASG